MEMASRSRQNHTDHEQLLRLPPFLLFLLHIRAGFLRSGVFFRIRAELEFCDSTTSRAESDAIVIGIKNFFN